MNRRSAEVVVDNNDVVVQDRNAKSQRPPLRFLVHAAMLSSASHVFLVGAFGTYWCTPSYGYNLFFGTYFAAAFFWPGTIYVNEIGSFFPHKNPQGARVRMPLLTIFKRIAIATSFMASVVAIASLVEGRITLPYQAQISSALGHVTPSWLAAGGRWLFQDGFIAGQQSNALRFIKLSSLWGFSFVTHFIGFGLIPVYLRKWWNAVKQSAQTLMQEEKDKMKKQEAEAKNE